MFDYERLEALSIEGEAPQSEPERQYYFMKKCRQWAEEEKERIGHPLTMSIQTLGCQMNAKDSEKMTAILEYIGYKEVEEPVADFVLYNTCTVRENANLKIYGRLGYLKNHKKKNPSMKIALCGCMMQEADEVERIRKSYSFVDLVFGTHNIYKLAELLYTQVQSARPVMDVWKVCRGNANIHLRPVSILCMAVTTFAVTVLCHMCAGEREAESRRILFLKLRGLWLMAW